MKNKADTFSIYKRKFIEEYAHQNLLDSLQLEILDYLDDAGGKATWFVLYQVFDRPRSLIEEAVRDLEAQDLIAFDFDVVRFSDYAPFVVDDVLTDLHEKFKYYMQKNPQLFAAETSFLA